MNMIKKISAAVIVAGIATGAHAEVFNADIVLAVPATIAQNGADVNFGTVELSASTTCALDAAAAVSGCTTISGTPNVAQLDITSTSGLSVQVTAAAGSDAGTNVTFTPFYNDDNASVLVDLVATPYNFTSTGTDSIYIGGEMAQSASAAAGTYAVSYTVTAAYW